MTIDSPTVGVVVPMYNAERTIGATLESVRSQTYSALDIIVVDDGSTDMSAAIVMEHSSRDPRIRLVHQANRGVAAARNFGVALTGAGFLAFVDADDLWAPTKVEQQLAVLLDGGPAAGLAYCWFAMIDAEDRVYSLNNQPLAEGRVLQHMCRRNFVGNGSSMMLRRAAFLAAGGFDSSLRARNAQGCEDMLMCLRVAEHFEFRVVPQYLVGYRMTNSNMSSDVRQMLRSCEIVLAEYREKYPELSGEMDAHLTDMLAWLAVRGLMGGRVLAACELIRRLVVLEPRMAFSHLPGMLDTYCRARLVPRWMKAGWRRVRNAEPRPPYHEMAW
ncbi:MAG: glycosyltransferase family 2 protein [Rhizobiaceae bacterium]